MHRSHKILVAVDGSVESNGALAWAVTEARIRDTGLTVVYVCDAAAYGLWTTTRTIRAGLRKLNQPIIHEALFRARRLGPDISIRGRVVLGSPSNSLLSISARTQLIVVGRQGKGALAAHLHGSVSQRLMTHAHCPVVTVSHPLGAGPADVVDRVVLAVGDRPTAGHALAFARAEAERRRIPLYAVHGRHVSRWPASGAQAAPLDPTVRIQQEECQLADLLARQGNDRNQAAITSIVQAGPAARVLRDICLPTDLLVLGQHRHGHFLPATLGPLISAVLHELRCAVAVVPEPAVEVHAPDPASIPQASGIVAY